MTNRVAENGSQREEPLRGRSPGVFHEKRILRRDETGDFANSAEKGGDLPPHRRLREKGPAKGEEGGYKKSRFDDLRPSSAEGKDVPFLPFRSNGNLLAGLSSPVRPFLADPDPRGWKRCPQRHFTASSRTGESVAALRKNVAQLVDLFRLLH